MAIATHLPKVQNSSYEMWRETKSSRLKKIMHSILLDRIVLESTRIFLVSEDPKDGKTLTHAYLRPVSKLEMLQQEKFAKQLLSASENILALLERWVRGRNLAIPLWKRWIKEYVTALQEKDDWKQEVPISKVGFIIYLRDDTAPFFNVQLQSAQCVGRPW